MRAIMSGKNEQGKIDVKQKNGTLEMPLACQ